MKIYPSRPLLILVAVAAFLLPASPAMALVGLTVNNGDEVNLVDDLGSIDLECDDVVVNGILHMQGGTLMNVGNLTVGSTGTLYLEDGTIYMSGDWDVAAGGTVDATTNITTGSTVEWSDTATTCGEPDFQITGDSTFYNLTITTTPGRTVTFGEGDTTTVNNHVILMGTGDETTQTTLLKIRSTSSGEPAFLVVLNTYAISSVDVKDNHATLPGLWIDPDYPQVFSSIDSGGNLRWFRSGEAESQIRFRVTKIFTDGNPNSVTVHLACNAGTFAIQESPLLADGTPVTFTVYHPGQGEGPYCRIWEEPQAGYTTDYEIPQGGCDAFTANCYDVDSGDEPGCFYENAFPGEGDVINLCEITNTPKPSTIKVNKTWVVAGGDVGFDGDYKISLKCHSPIIAPSENAYFKSWDWTSKSGDPSGAGVKSNAAHGDMEWEFTLPHPIYMETCTLEEEVDDSIVSMDLSGCGEPVEERGRDSKSSSELAVGPGEDVECAIVNTAFFEGIPTLSPFGMAVLALLMLGIGMFGFRRLV